MKTGEKKTKNLLEPSPTLNNLEQQQLQQQQQQQRTS